MTSGAARIIFQINDLSLYIDQLMKGYVVVAVKTERGPLWTPVPITSWDEFERIFGRTFSASTDPLVLKMGLLQGAKFIVIRLVHCTDPGDKATMTAIASSVTIKDSGSTPTAAKVESSVGPFIITEPTAGVFTGTEVGPFTFVEGVADSIKITVGAGVAQTVQLSGVAISAEAVADLINAGTNGVTASVVSGKLRLQANSTSDGLAVGAVTADCYSILGFIQSNFEATAGTNTLVFAVDGGANQSFALTSGTRTATQVADDLSAMTGGGALPTNGKLRIVSATTGLSSSITIDSTSTARLLLGFDTSTHNGTAGVSQDTIGFAAANPGEWGDNLKVHTYEGSLVPEETFDVRISYSLQSSLDEYFANLNMNPESDRYAINYINERSKLVTAVDKYSTNTYPTNRPVLDGNGVSLTGGDNGLVGFNDADYIGDPLVQTGFYAANQTDLAIDIMVPGSSSVTVLQALAAYCEDEGVYVSYSNFPAGLDPMEAKAFRMGESPYGHEAFNSHRLCLFYARPTVYDSRTDSKYEVSSMGHLASCICKTDTLYDYHYAPVGPRRGVVDFVESVDYNLADYKGYQAMFADYGMNYLQIVRQQGVEGAVFWEQFTTQRAASALRDLNVVRFLTMMRRVLVPLLRMFLFEPNHPSTWREVHRALEPVFDEWKDRFSIYDFCLQTDRDAYYQNGELKNATLNSGLSVDQGTYRARALIQPTKALRYLEFEVGVLRTGEAFANYTELKELPNWARR
jgi:hypothetical protein